jgi:3-hydroxyacyl-CoA dehydrogenase
VLGAGVMGAQIAAHCANANVPVVLFDLPAKEGDPDGIVRRALDGLKKLEPAPLATPTSCNTSTSPTTTATSHGWPTAIW